MATKMVSKTRAWMMTNELPRAENDICLEAERLGDDVSREMDRVQHRDVRGDE
jgi:hypothetical protein